MPNQTQSTCTRMPRLSEVQQHCRCEDPWTERKRPCRECLWLELLMIKWPGPKRATLLYVDNINAHDHLQHTSAYFVVMAFGEKPVMNLQKKEHTLRPALVLKGKSS